MASLPVFPSPRIELPDYLPARMVNEYVYCPRLFFYEWVEGVFRESADTVEGSQQHARVDKEGGGLPASGELAEEQFQTRSITLSSEMLRVIAKLDLLEVENGELRPVDYKHGSPNQKGEENQAWPSDRVQLAVQAIILREHGYRCDEGLVYYAATRQRVRVLFTQAVIAEATQAIKEAWETARNGILPPPLDCSPKCPGCSLAPICLPDETRFLYDSPDTGHGQLQLFASALPRIPPQREIRRLITPRADRKPVYLDTQGLRVGKSGDVLQVKEKETLRQQIRLHEVCQINLMGNIQVTTQAIQSLCEAEIPVTYFSQGGWFYGITTGMSTKNVFLRQQQFRLASEDWFCRRLARQLVAGKIRNQRTMLLRNHIEAPSAVLRDLKGFATKAEDAQALESLLGIEGAAARLYFGALSGMLKPEDETSSDLTFDFTARNRRPPRDPINALLSLAYGILAKDFTIACYAVGFDPMMGFYHQPRFGRPALALDLMEPFRPLIADSAVLSAVNTGMVTLKDFISASDSVGLTPSGRKAFYRAYELRMDTLVTHPLFEYRVNYRRLLEIQARLLARLIEGEIDHYPVFVTR